MARLTKSLDARAKVVLLAATYLDACIASQPSASLQTKLLVGRTHELWDAGSYWDLERSLDQLRREHAKRHLWFWRTFVSPTNHGWILRHTDPTVDLAAHKANHARQGLTRVVDLINDRTGRNIYVPDLVVLWGGFEPWQAKEAARPRKRIAA